MAKNGDRQPDHVTTFQGPVIGPVHTGSGDIRIGRLSYGTSADALEAVRDELVTRIDAASYCVVSAIVGKLSQDRIEELDEVVRALEEQRLSQREMMDLLSLAHTALLEARQRKLVPGTSQAVSELVEMVEAPHLDVAHKLKLTVPIIPLLLDYEAEVQLGSRLNLETAWEWLRKKSRRR